MCKVKVTMDEMDEWIDERGVEVMA